ncbi:hypothetical protein Tco_0552592, partial [Tanacetum coccineum]
MVESSSDYAEELARLQNKHIKPMLQLRSIRVKLIMQPLGIGFLL